MNVCPNPVQTDPVYVPPPAAANQPPVPYQPVPTDPVMMPVPVRRAPTPPPVVMPSTTVVPVDTGYVTETPTQMYQQQAQQAMQRKMPKPKPPKPPPNPNQPLLVTETIAAGDGAQILGMGNGES